MRVLATATLALLLTIGVAAQHKIPPLPETASAPKKLASGITIIDLKPGTGIPAEKGRMVRITYTGWVSATQVMFDFRDERTGPLAFHLGGGGPVEGLERGVYGMRVGGKRRVIVPPRLGYGSRTTRGVPAGSELTYDVELVSVARPGV
jgi:FKBP-type peptidyl-prolyl cis-trans isomerase FkpA